MGRALLLGLRSPRRARRRRRLDEDARRLHFQRQRGSILFHRAGCRALAPMTRSPGGAAFVACAGPDRDPGHRRRRRLTGRPECPGTVLSGSPPGPSQSRRFALLASTTRSAAPPSARQLRGAASGPHGGDAHVFLAFMFHRVAKASRRRGPATPDWWASFGPRCVCEILDSRTADCLPLSTFDEWNLRFVEGGAPTGCI